MIFNYLKVGIRNFLKYKTFSFINVFGLAAAMSVCMLIMLMLADQRSYDTRIRIIFIVSSVISPILDTRMPPLPSRWRMH